MNKFASTILMLLTVMTIQAQTSYPKKLERNVANINNGVTYVDQGNGFPIVFIHGTLSNADTWRKIIPELSQKYRCIAPDLPIGGHSIALTNNIDLTPIGISNIIYQCFQILKIKKAIIISNDTGGAYAQIFAARHPELVEKMIFSNCEVGHVFPPKKFKYLIKAVKVPDFTYLLSRAFKLKKLLKSNMMMGLLSHRVTQNELFELYLKSFIEQKGIRKNFASNVQSWSPNYIIKAAEKLKKEKFPVLILWGEDDIELFPIELGKELKNTFTNSTLVKIAHSKTYVQEDQPERVIEEITNFIGTGEK